MKLTMSYQKVSEIKIGNTGYADIYLRLYAKYNSQSISNNTSSVSYKSTIYFNNGSFYASSTTTKSLSGDGASPVNNENAVGNYYQGETTLNEITGTVTHNAGGDKSVSCSANFYSIPWGWNATASASSLELPVIPRYATIKQSLKKKTETTIEMDWSSDRTIDHVWYSIDNGSTWIEAGGVLTTKGYYTISNLKANTAYNIKTRLRSQASQLTTDSSAMSITTYNYPYITTVATSNLIIGNGQKLTLYNPLSRAVTVKMNKDSINGAQLYSGTTTSTNITFTPTASTLYTSIPNSKSAKCVYSIIYSASTKTTNQYTYSVNESNCTPIFSNFTYADVDTTATSLTNDNQLLVNNNSNCQFTILVTDKAVARNGASIVKYKCEWGAKSSEISYSSTANVTTRVDDSTGNTLKVTAIDSRGLSTSITKSITNIAYVNAVINEVTPERKDGIDIETYLKLKLTLWNGNWKNGSNTAYNNQLNYVGYRVYDGSNWTNYFDITDTVKTNMSSYVSGNSLIINVPISKNMTIHANGASNGFDVGKEYVIQVLIKDGTSSVTFTPAGYQATLQGTVSDGKVGLARYKGSNGEYHYAVNGMPNSDFTFKVHGNFSATDVAISKSASTIDGSVSYCGATTNHSDIKELKNYKTFLGSAHINGTWYNVLSTRHRNGASDGISYGMMFYSTLTSNGDLKWNKQTGATSWQGERTLVDSSNISSYNFLTSSLSSNYERFSDGTLICYGSVTCKALTKNSGTNTTITLPQKFKDTNYRVSLTCTGSGAYWSHIQPSCSTKTATTMTIYFWNNATESSAQCTFDYTVIGRWK